ncbi:MAG: hypothetical protein QOI41_3782 [Myxococcales bacterium]|nr:hypothetical protein [Myxococcales bacterium]
MAQKEEKAGQSAENARASSAKSEPQGAARAMQPARQQQQNMSAYGGGITPQALTPFSFVRRMIDDVDRIFGGGMLGAGMLGPIIDDTLAAAAWVPQVEVMERNGKLVVRADLPGLDLSDIRVMVEDDALTLEGERRVETEDKGEGYFRSERSYGTFVRRIPLPRGVDRNTTEAKFENGVLEITMNLPKAAPQRVEVKGGATAARTGSTAQQQQQLQQGQQTQQQQGQQAQGQQAQQQERQGQNGPQSAPRH